jgi:hypothetical protein
MPATSTIQAVPFEALEPAATNAPAHAATSGEVADAGERTARYPHWLKLAGAAMLTVALLALAWAVADQHVYSAGDAIGYNLGLAGGIAMLTLLLYPLRKRIRVLSGWGGMTNWFRYHMALGIFGPLLIVFHTTFRIGSMNARVALYSMLLVFVSGVIGRFVYRHIHAGLYGRRLTLEEAESEQEASVEAMGELLGWVPEMDTRLREFRQYAMRRTPGTAARIWRFVSLRYRGRALRRKLLKLARSALDETALTQNWGPATLAHYRRQAGERTDAYISAVCSAVQFSVWERLFALWHVALVPFVYLMVICGVTHVVAVHMY